MMKNTIVIGALLIFICVFINLILGDVLLSFDKGCQSLSFFHPCNERKEQAQIVSYVFLLLGVLFMAYGLVAGGRPAAAKEIVYIRCSQCGEKNSQRDTVCRNCGARLKPLPEVAKKFVICPRCTIENSEDALYCKYCRMPLKPAARVQEKPKEVVLVRCLKCGTENQNDAKFCKKCGSLLAPPEQPVVEKILCLHCNSENTVDAEFCAKCGAPLKPPAQQPAQEQPAPSQQPEQEQQPRQEQPAASESQEPANPPA